MSHFFRTLLCLLILAFTGFGLAAQTARLQVIHNAPQPVVDIYVNGNLLLNDFAFRTATPFIDVPANTPLSVAVAPSTSTSVSDAIAVFPITLDSGKTYVVMAAGVVGDTGATAFKLFINDQSREKAADSTHVDIAAFHGSPDAPAVDIDAVFVADNVISNLAFGNFTPYLSLPPTKYDLAIRPAGNSATVASFRADLSGLKGGAATVFASGFLGSAPSFGLFAALPDGTVIALPLTPTARVQVIHNSPSPTVDVYAGNTRLINDFAFRTATPFIDVPADRDINLGIAPGSSSSAADAIANFPVNLTTGGTYSVIAGGVVGNTGATAFNLFVNDKARESAANGANVDIAAFHGSPNAPAVDVDAVFVADNVISNLAFGNFTPYLSLPPAKYDLAVRPAGNSAVVASFRADLSGLAGGAATVFASGFVGSTPAFGLFAALPDGTVIALPLTPTARVQVIHNSPSPTVDVYAGNTRLINDFAFRTATPYIDVPADRDINLGIAPGSSSSAADAIANFPVNLTAGGTYSVIAAGVVGNSGATAFNLFINDKARESAANGANVDIAAFHGSPNAPAVDVDAVFVADNVISNLAFGNFTPYLSLPPAKYDLAVRPAGNSAVVASFRADLSGLAGGAATVFASGFVGSTPSFGLFAALPDGTVIALPLTPTARVQVIHNSPSPTVDVYAGNTRLINDFAFRTATPFIDVPADRDINLGIAPGSSSSVADAIANFPVNLTTGGTYSVIAAGVVGNSGATAFNLFVNPNAKETAGAGLVDVNLFHGSPDAPAVDVLVPNGPVLFNDVVFGQFAPYFSAPAGNYTIYVTPSNDNSTVVAAYKADITTLAGQAITVFASGYLGGQTPGFEVWVALPNGTTFPLQLTVSTKDIDLLLTSFSIRPNPARDLVQVSFGLERNTDVTYRILDMTGKVVLENALGPVFAGSYSETIHVDGMESGNYLLQVITNEGYKTTKLVIVR